MLKLDVGSGPEPREGYTTVDKYAPADVSADMGDLPYEDGTVDEIWSSHALEHVTKAEILPVLREWHRVLVPGGLLTLQVPDLVWCCRAWLEHRTNDWWMDIIFGNQENPGEIHKTGFTMPILRAYVEAAGFAIVSSGSVWNHQQGTLEVIARKP
jgi:predicted SAM-dependent methyltransferase